MNSQNIIFIGPRSSGLMAEMQVIDWDGLIAKVHGPCGGCPRNATKSPVLFNRRTALSDVEFIVVSQEPGFWLRSDQAKAEENLQRLCMTGKLNLSEIRQANPLSKILHIFGNFDPCGDRVYWTHALKCIPSRSDRDINKEWRKVATRCKEIFLDEIRLLGKKDLNVIVFGKYALELCLHALDDQDIDQELSISEFMQNNRLPLAFSTSSRMERSRTYLFVYGNPSSEVVNIRKSGGKMTVEEIQDIETSRIQDAVKSRR